MSRLRSWVPTGAPLSEEVWSGRHKAFVAFLVAQAVGLVGFALVRGYSPLHSFVEGGIVAAAAAAACLPGTGRAFRSVAVTIGLLSASAILVHLSGGTIEAHFHFFVMVSLVTLYQSWTPFLLSIGYVVVHHGFVGTLAPESVYNHPAALANPVRWALIHGAFILGASVAGLIVWKRNEDLRLREQEHLLLTRELDAFSARVAHDLRNPLATIEGAAVLAAKIAAKESETRDLLDLIQRQVGKANELIRGLLDLARCNGTPRLDTVRLPGLVTEVAAEHPDVVTEIGDLPQVVTADPLNLRQALANLFQNSIRYGTLEDEPAAVTITGSESDGSWTLAFSDRGPGIVEDEPESLFAPLARGRNAAPGGSGLGLAIVAAVAETHGGRAWYEARPGGGSTFWMSFSKTPLGASQETPRRAPAAPSLVEG
ncbi:MAG: sensor histidine kinase [Actinomycetota bacterium]